MGAWWRARAGGMYRWEERRRMRKEMAGVNMRNPPFGERQFQSCEEWKDARYERGGYKCISCPGSNRKFETNHSNSKTMRLLLTHEKCPRITLSQAVAVC